MALYKLTRRNDGREKLNLITCYRRGKLKSGLSLNYSRPTYFPTSPSSLTLGNMHNYSFRTFSENPLKCIRLRLLLSGTWWTLLELTSLFLLFEPSSWTSLLPWRQSASNLPLRYLLCTLRLLRHIFASAAASLYQGVPVSTNWYPKLHGNGRDWLRTGSERILRTRFFFSVTSLLSLQRSLSDLDLQHLRITKHVKQKVSYFMTFYPLHFITSVS